MDAILNNIEKGSTIYSDRLPEYKSLKQMDFVHETVNHLNEYVRGEVHTNGLENFWSLFKRAVKGTYVAVAPFHVARYVTEEAFRFNNRLKSDFERFYQALSQVVGKRLTYRKLAAVGDCGFMGIE